jgi:hypothetical protein
MPIEHLVDEERRLLEVVFLGPVSKDEIVELRRELEKAQLLGYNALVDLRQGSINLEILEIREVASEARARGWPRARCAFVSPHDPSFTDLKLFELWGARGPREYRVFRSLGEACAWLGLDRAGLCLEETASG